MISTEKCPFVSISSKKKNIAEISSVMKSETNKSDLLHAAKETWKKCQSLR